MFPNPDQPAYTSILVVRKDAPYQQFADLHSATLAYNDVFSLSGFHCIRFHVVGENLQEPFFAHAFASGGHMRSVLALVENRADVAAIDINVIRSLIRENSPLLDDLRVLDDVQFLGPHISQPFVAPHWLDPSLRERIRAALCACPKELLSEMGWEKIVPVSLEDFSEVQSHLEACSGRPVVSLIKSEFHRLLEDHTLNPQNP